MTLVQAGHGLLIVLGAIGVTAGVLLPFEPTHTTLLGATVAVCAALGTYLGRYLPSASDKANIKAVAAATPAGSSTEVEGTK